MHDPSSPKSWFDKGDNDLASAKVIFQQLPVRDTVCFHCQQAVEKYLKGYLLYLGIAFRFSHDLEYLIELIDAQESVPEDYLELASHLEDFGVQVRYPKVIKLPTDPEIESIFQSVEALRSHFLSKIP